MKIHLSRGNCFGARILLNFDWLLVQCQNFVKTFILILNFNGKKDTLECLKSLKKAKVSTEIIIIDNGSTDGSVQLIKARFPEIKVIENRKNLGFAAGNNVGDQICS